MKILATGIGSMPHTEATSALELIFKYTPFVPFWPQLPRRSLKEGMILQFSESFPYLEFTSQGLIIKDNYDVYLHDFYEHLIGEDIDYFKIDEDFASGIYRFYEELKMRTLEDIEFIKCQITGPFTFSASIKDKEGFSLLHNPILMEATTKGLIRKAVWQIKFFAEFKKKIIIFFDEPYLGCFGSAYTPIERDQVIKLLSESFQEFKMLSKRFLNKELNQEVLLGIHCCGNTDWSIFTDILEIDIISFDAFSFLERVLLYTDDIKGFFKRGGLLCWGIIPTLEFKATETEEFLLERIKEAVKFMFKKGIDRDLILERAIFSPACGLGGVSEENSQKILKLLFNTTNKLFDKLI
ncbi:MAG: hypothetical protein NC900_02725 [Candidatus Omnitrophica bacterium]|nr:hypothetical protein [Candidatus Omnitrophota bacterium]